MPGRHSFGVGAGVVRSERDGTLGWFLATKRASLAEWDVEEDSPLAVESDGRLGWCVGHEESQPS